MNAVDWLMSERSDWSKRGVSRYLLTTQRRRTLDHADAELRRLSREAERAAAHTLEVIELAPITIPASPQNAADAGALATARDAPLASFPASAASSTEL
jgi:hypothetical protein